MKFKKNINFGKTNGLVTFLVCFLFLSVSAQNDSIAKKWNYLGELYMMFPNMSGETGIGNLPVVSVDADVSDVLGHLKMGAMFYLEATNNDWTISSDFLYMKLEQDVVPKTIINGGKLVMEETAWELAGLKKVQPWLDLGLGARLVNLQSEIDIQTVGESRSGSIDKTWVDPVIIARTKGDFSDKVFWQFRGDLGGFGIGSDFTWQAQANIGYQFSKLFQTSIGYRYIAIDYDKGDGSNQFIYDVDTFGAVIRFGFNF